ncbi:MAG: hypothetical protein Fur0025_30770 [Oscillatoriaceae cyanobacterium]
MVVVFHLKGFAEPSLSQQPLDVIALLQDEGGTAMAADAVVSVPGVGWVGALGV